MSLDILPQDQFYSSNISYCGDKLESFTNEEQEEDYEIPNFDDLKITTTTLILQLEGQVVPEAAFQLLPITRVNMPVKRSAAKCKLPHCPTPGAILSMKFKNSTRGVVRSIKRPFKNAVTIDISTSKKNISVKLSDFKMQICGAPSKEDGHEAATLIIQHMKYIQYVLYKMRDNPKLTLEIIEWVNENTKGELVERTKWEDVGVLKVAKTFTDYIVVYPSKSIPAHFDYEIAMFIAGMCADFYYHSDMLVKTNFMPNVVDIISPNLSIKAIDYAMVNYNFDIGFRIDRERLDMFINERNGFFSRYNNEHATCVTVEFPYVPEENGNIKIKKNKVHKISFLNYSSGMTTLSSNGNSITRDVYYLYMNTIRELRPYIELK